MNEQGTITDYLGTEACRIDEIRIWIFEVWLVHNNGISNLTYCIKMKTKTKNNNKNKRFSS